MPQARWRKRLTRMLQSGPLLGTSLLLTILVGCCRLNLHCACAPAGAGAAPKCRHVPPRCCRCVRCCCATCFQDERCTLMAAVYMHALQHRSCAPAPSAWLAEAAGSHLPILQPNILLPLQHRSCTPAPSAWRSRPRAPTHCSSPSPSSSWCVIYHAVLRSHYLLPPACARCSLHWLCPHSGCQQLPSCGSCHICVAAARKPLRAIFRPAPALPATQRLPFNPTLLAPLFRRSSSVWRPASPAWPTRATPKRGCTADGV